LFTVELDRRLSARGVRSFAVHPGMIATELGRHMTRDDFKALSARAKSSPSGGLPPRKSLEAGAATSVWASTASELDGRGGVYCEDCAISDQHAPWALDDASARRLWSLSESLVAQQFPE
jgi:NAD(P)-dependent dehydrogenase (short-subunit alcohol dehydrogenase family)